MELMGTSPKIDLYSHPLFLRMVNEHGFESCLRTSKPNSIKRRSTDGTDGHFPED